MVEYGVQTLVEPLPYVCGRWVSGSPEALRRVRWPTSGVLQVHDRHDRLVCLFASPWELNHLVKEYPELTFEETG